MFQKDIEAAATMMRRSTQTLVMTGAGISVESGVPPFRGKGGLWEKHDPRMVEIGYFKTHPSESWHLMRELFYQLKGKVKPNRAHYILADMEAKGMVQNLVTQNVDMLHTEAGSKDVQEFHGSMKEVICLECGATENVMR